MGCVAAQASAARAMRCQARSGTAVCAAAMRLALFYLNKDKCLLAPRDDIDLAKRAFISHRENGIAM